MSAALIISYIPCDAHHHILVYLNLQSTRQNSVILSHAAVANHIQVQLLGYFTLHSLPSHQKRLVSSTLILMYTLSLAITGPYTKFVTDSSGRVTQVARLSYM